MIRVKIYFSIGEVETRDFTNWYDALDYIRSLVDFYWIKKVEIYEHGL